MLTCKFGAIHRSGIKLLIGNFNGMWIMSFIPDWVSEILNQSGLRNRKLMLLLKNKGSLEKVAITGYHEFHSNHIKIKKC